jgi:hypothetical protein
LRLRRAPGQNSRILATLFTYPYTETAALDCLGRGTALFSQRLLPGGGFTRLTLLRPTTTDVAAPRPARSFVRKDPKADIRSRVGTGR